MSFILSSKKLSSETCSLMFKERAWIKMKMLVDYYNTEVGWHGIVKRDTSTRFGFIVSDILVYPQIVSGASIDTDDEEYANWLYSLDNKTFNRLRLQGHSHVRMPVSPSSTDTGYWKELAVQVGEPDVENRFYIFMIANKLGNFYFRVYDFARGMYFSNRDVISTIIPEKKGIVQFLKESLPKVNEGCHIKAEGGV